MLHLRKMTQQEYQEYLTTAITDYAEEKIIAETWQKEEALELAKNSFQQLLPQGSETDHEYLYMIQLENSEEVIGNLWVHLEKKSELTIFFIYDFIIFDAYRNQGFGRKALAALEILAKQKNVQRIDLHVFAHNKGAVHLYQSVGFEATDISMSKKVVD